MDFTKYSPPFHKIFREIDVFNLLYFLWLLNPELHKHVNV